MLKVSFFLSSFLILISSAHAGQMKKYHGRSYVDGEILVKYKSNTTSFFQQQSIEKFGAKRLKRINSRGLSHVKISKGRSMESALAEFKQDPDVEFAQPNFIYKISAVPNDTYYSRQWGLKNTGQTIVSTGLGGPDTPWSENNPGTAGKDMGLETAWDTITDCSSVVVAVIDSGVNYNHNDLSTNMWDGGGTYPNHGYDFVENTTDPMDKNGHGTHVAGTIGAVGNNGAGTTGVCWKANIMAVRVMNAIGEGTSATIVQGIDFAVANGAKVINMSLGGSGVDAAQSTAITNAQSHGVLVVVAAGNDGENNDSGSTPMYPCNYGNDNIVCVAALTQSNALASFSNYGTTSVDVGAPGVNIVSTWPGTSSVTTNVLTSGWSTSGSGWGYKSLNFGSANPALVNPTNYDHSTASYANNADDRIWRAFNTSGAISSVLDFYLMLDSESGKDFVTIKASSSSGDPIPTGTTLESFAGSTGGSRYPFSYDLTPYIGANTTVGFNFTSNASGTSFGTNITLLSVTSLYPNGVTYNVISGTSMASPHVAGLAAMLFAYNPNYTYTDVANSIKKGGVSVSALSTVTVTGKAANATNSLAYINAPTGVTLSKIP